jgi:hypothetical protein
VAVSNYPDYTWAGDPRAPWNESWEDQGMEDDWETENEFCLDGDCDEY